MIEGLTINIFISIAVVSVTQVYFGILFYGAFWLIKKLNGNGFKSQPRRR